LKQHYSDASATVFAGHGSLQLCPVPKGEENHERTTFCDHRGDKGLKYDEMKPARGDEKCSPLLWHRKEKETHLTSFVFLFVCITLIQWILPMSTVIRKEIMEQKDILKQKND